MLRRQAKTKVSLSQSAAGGGVPWIAYFDAIDGEARAACLSLGLLVATKGRSAEDAVSRARSELLAEIRDCVDAGIACRKVPAEACLDHLARFVAAIQLDKTSAGATWDCGIMPVAGDRAA